MLTADLVTRDRFRPSVARGRDLAVAMRCKLASSFRHLADACAPHVAFDVLAVERQIESIEASERVRPELFVIHYDCREAATRNDFDGVIAAFGALCDAPVAAPSALLRRNWGDAGFALAERGRYQWAFGDEGDTPIRLTAAMPAVFETSCRAVDAALVALADADPELHGENVALVQEIVFAQGDPAAELTFDGITTVNAFGAVVLNPAEIRSVPAAVAGFVHEAAHALLFAAGEGHSMVENDPGERYASPLRPDPRPMNGVFHATFVAARMAYALESALVADVLADADRAEARSLLDGAREAFSQGHAVFAAHGVATPLGASFMRDAAEYMRA